MFKCLDRRRTQKLCSYKSFLCLFFLSSTLLLQAAQQDFLPTHHLLDEEKKSAEESEMNPIKIASNKPFVRAIRDKLSKATKIDELVKILINYPLITMKNLQVNINLMELLCSEAVEQVVENHNDNYNTNYHCKINRKNLKDVPKVSLCFLSDADSRVFLELVKKAKALQVEGFSKVRIAHESVLHNKTYFPIKLQCGGSVLNVIYLTMNKEDYTLIQKHFIDPFNAWLPKKKAFNTDLAKYIKIGEFDYKWICPKSLPEHEQSFVPQTDFACVDNFLNYWALDFTKKQVRAARSEIIKSGEVLDPRPVCGLIDLFPNLTRFLCSSPYIDVINQGLAKGFQANISIEGHFLLDSSQDEYVTQRFYYSLTEDSISVSNTLSSKPRQGYDLKT